MDNPKKHVACGLQVTATVEYNPDKEEDLQDRLILYVGDKTLEIPVIGYSISIYPTLLYIYLDYRLAEWVWSVCNLCLHCILRAQIIKNVYQYIILLFSFFLNLLIAIHLCSKSVLKEWQIGI